MSEPEYQDQSAVEGGAMRSSQPVAMTPEAFEAPSRMRQFWGGMIASLIVFGLLGADRVSAILP